MSEHERENEQTPVVGYLQKQSRKTAMRCPRGPVTHLPLITTSRTQAYKKVLFSYQWLVNSHQQRTHYPAGKKENQPFLLHAWSTWYNPAQRLFEASTYFSSAKEALCANQLRWGDVA